MPRTCSICTHERREEIDRALVTGRVMAKISAKWGVSADALARHKANHLLPALRDQAGADPELKDVNILEELKNLYGRMKRYLERAERADNWPAIKVFHSEARQDLELLARLVGKLDNRTQVNVLVSAEWLRVRAVLLEALAPYPEVRAAVAARLAELERGNERSD